MRPLRDAAAVHSAEETPLPRVAIPLLAAAAAIAAVVEAAGASAALANSTVNPPTRNLASEEPTNATAAEAKAEPEEEKEPEPVEMTLDEWKALQEQEKPKTAFQIRRAGEGVDDKQWGEMVALKKKNDSSDEEE